MGDNIWSAINAALVALRASRNQFGPDDPNAQRLDQMISALLSDQQIVGRAQVRTALNDLTNADVLDHLKGLTTHLNASVAQLNSVANDLNTAAMVVSIAASIVTTILPLL